jgi:hypothetical protein
MFREIKIWIELTIPGFLYLLTGFFLFLLCFNINDLKFLQNTRDYLPYISIIIIVLSSIVGHTAYKVLQHLIYFVRPKFKYNATNNVKLIRKVPEIFQTPLSESYIVFVFFRHLIIGTFSVGCVLVIWLGCSNNTQYQYPIILICVIFIFLFILSYIFQRKTHKAFKEAIEKEFAL